MKGVCFQKPFELTLLVQGESWQQGDTVTGSLEVKNHSSEPVSIDGFKVHLAEADLKKVRAKSGDAFELSGTQTAPSAALVPAGGKGSFEWKFTLDRNCSITDNVGSPYLLYGQGEALEKVGQIQLTVKPHPAIEEILSRFSVPFRFVQKSRKAMKDGTEIKLDPPDGKQYMMVEQLAARFKIEENSLLHVRYQFQVKKMEANVGGTVTKIDKRLFEQDIPLDKLKLPSGRWDHDFIEVCIQEALATVSSKVIF